MFIPRPEREPHPSTGASHRTSSRPPATHKPLRGHILVESVDQCVSVLDTARADIAVVVIEDLCWSIAMADWSARRPSVWRRRARTAWRADGEALAAMRDRISTMAGEIGLVR